MDMSDEADIIHELQDMTSAWQLLGQYYIAIGLYGRLHRLHRSVWAAPVGRLVQQGCPSRTTLDLILELCEYVLKKRDWKHLTSLRDVIVKWPIVYTQSQHHHRVLEWVQLRDTLKTYNMCVCIDKPPHALFKA
jgi:hypothetical protein